MKNRIIMLFIASLFIVGCGEVQIVYPGENPPKPAPPEKYYVNASDAEVIRILHGALDGKNWIYKWNLDYMATMNGSGKILQEMKHVIWTLDPVDKEYRVTMLNLTDDNIRGQIPSEIGKLDQLEGLSIAGERVVGDLPETFINLQQLQRLEIRNTGLNGRTIGLLGGLEQLRFLYVTSNRFNCEIPPELANLKPAAQVELIDNNFIGSVPEEFFGMTPYIMLTNNNLTSLPATYWDSPRRIGLRGNRLAGVISKEIQALSYFGFTYPLLTPQQEGYGFTLEAD